jgi:hypothetical protein
MKAINDAMVQEENSRRALPTAEPNVIPAAVPGLGGPAVRKAPQPWAHPRSPLPVLYSPGSYALGGQTMKVIAPGLSAREEDPDQPPHNWP